jgi:stage V sporulation protein G
MHVTEVRVKLNLHSPDRLRGFCSITLDGCFVVRDIKIIEGPGGLFVAMPSRKLMAQCSRCRGKNPLKSRYCGMCGAQLEESFHGNGEDGRGGAGKLHCDVAHPINAECRRMVQEAVREAYAAEVEKSKQPGYVVRDLEEVEVE